MDKIDIILIPFIYLLRTTLTILNKIYRSVPTPSKLWSVPRNGATWIAIIGLHSVLFTLSALDRLTQIWAVKVALNMAQNLTIVRICLYWPNFYWSLFRPKPNRRSIWAIITCPVPPDGPKANEQSNRIPCMNAKFCCFSFYQVQGTHAHLNQKTEKDLDRAVAAATAIVFYDDPLHLAVPCIYCLKMLPKPPNGVLRSILSLIIF